MARKSRFRYVIQDFTITQKEYDCLVAIAALGDLGRVVFADGKARRQPNSIKIGVVRRLCEKGIIDIIDEWYGEIIYQVIGRINAEIIHRTIIGVPPAKEYY